MRNVYIALAVVAAVLVFYFFIYRRSAKFGNTASGAAVGSNFLSNLFPPTVPPATKPVSSLSGTNGLKAGVSVAATAGCIAYTSGVGTPVCSALAPIGSSIAVDVGSKVASGAKSVVSKIGSWF